MQHNAHIRSYHINRGLITTHFNTITFGIWDNYVAWLGSYAGYGSTPEAAIDNLLAQLGY